MRRRNPCAPNILVDRMCTTVTPLLHATDFRTFLQDTDSAHDFCSQRFRTPRVQNPHWNILLLGRKHRRRVQTFAPKYASSAASSNEIVLTGCASGTRFGSHVSTPSTSVHISIASASMAAPTSDAEKSDPPRPSVVVTPSCVRRNITAHHGYVLFANLCDIGRSPRVCLADDRRGLTES